MTFEEFRKETLKVEQSRKHKISNSIGVYDVYKFIRKNKWMKIGQRISEHDFYTIIRTINKSHADQLCQGNDIILPYRMGTLELRKRNSTTRIQDNKLIVTKPIDWQSTLKLWHEDIECKKDKVLVRQHQNEVFRVRYSKKNAIYNNKAFFSFRPTREIKVRLKEQIINNNIDAFKYYE